MLKRLWRALQRSQPIGLKPVVTRKNASISRQSTRHRVARAIEVFGDDAMIQVFANNMAAGPCRACIDLAAQPVPIQMAPDGPLPGCPHPDQCSLLWRTVFKP